MTTTPTIDQGEEQMEAREYRKTATIRATQWFKMGDHPAVTLRAFPLEFGAPAKPWIETLEGGHVVTPGDWIATGVKGEHWPIKPDVFAATYEPVGTPSPTETPDTEVGRLRRDRDDLLSTLIYVSTALPVLRTMLGAIDLSKGEQQADTMIRLVQDALDRTDATTPNAPAQAPATVMPEKVDVAGLVERAQEWLTRFHAQLDSFKGDTSGQALAYLGNQAEVAARHVTALLDALSTVQAPSEVEGRYVTMWRKTGDKMLEWDHYVSEDDREVGQVVGNIKKQGVRQYLTYRLGSLVPERTAMEYLPASATPIQGSSQGNSRG